MRAPTGTSALPAVATGLLEDVAVAVDCAALRAPTCPSDCTPAYAPTRASSATTTPAAHAPLLFGAGVAGAWVVPGHCALEAYVGTPTHGGEPSIVGNGVLATVVGAASAADSAHHRPCMPCENASTNAPAVAKRCSGCFDKTFSS